eukprot:scaffold4420_cov187-Amphora_coffeaeformis.AAC.9
MMIIDNSSGSISIDQELSRAAQESLTLGEHHVTKILATERVCPPRQNYGRLYQVSLPQTPPLTIPVPGFPDFPDCWQGFEGGLVVQEQQNKKNHRRQQLSSRGSSSLKHNPSLLYHAMKINCQSKQIMVRRKMSKRIWKRQAVNPQACRRRKQPSRKLHRDGHKLVNNPQRGLSSISYELANLKIHSRDAS